jgi:hypothetical protein
MDFYFPAGLPAARPGPLARFLPSLHDGNVSKALEQVCQPGDRLFDPFGSSPRLAIEAAQAGHGIVVAVNNPVTRFILQHSLLPISPDVLKSALASFASSQKDGGRLEPFLLDLYRTVCSRCGEAVSADYFVWDKEIGEPILKAYHCTHCHQTVEEGVLTQDIEYAMSFADARLQTSLALERVATIDDPDREHAEAALQVYPPRALYALVTLLTKLEQLTFDQTHKFAAQALLLAAFDEANALWGYPEGRVRPLSLAVSVRYRENNVWRALEKGIDLWTIDSPEIKLTDWRPDGLPSKGEVTLHAGAARDLVPDLPAGAIQHVVSVLPRPNQAFWSLSALWAAWLWGPESAVPIKAVLRRRRYDWTWHAAALRTTFERIKPALTGEEIIISLIPDCEPGFLAAALSSLDAADFSFYERAYRLGERQAILLHINAGSGPSASEKLDPVRMMREAILDDLTDRGEPASFPYVHASAWSRLANDRALASQWREKNAPPISNLVAALESVLQDEKRFLRFRKGAEIESGLYWLTDPVGSQNPLVDRVERYILEYLRQESEVDFLTIDQEVCRFFRGIQAPNRRIVLACLRSYALQSSENARWKLREEDRAEARLRDHQEIEDLLLAIGRRLGFSVNRDPVRWDAAVQMFRFHILETAALLVEVPGLLQSIGAEEVRSQMEAPTAELEVPRVSDVCVIPGGRSALFAEKVRRDPRLGLWLESGGRVIKFRHVRRLADETTLNIDNLDDRLAIDPPEHQDPQMPLL